MPTQKKKEKESVEKQEIKKNSKERRKNENISFNVHLQVLVPVITEIAIQPYQY